MADRTDVLAKVDLGELLDELTGPRTRLGRSARWHCPDPGHPDEHPSVTMHLGRDGIQRWTCWSGGHGGTAIDALILARTISIGEAITELSSSVTQAPVRQRPTTQPVTPVTLHPCVVQYAEACEKILWSRSGRPVLDYLTSRGLDPHVLRTNRVGADPGPELLRRPRGLPTGGPGAVLPALNEHHEIIYTQTRYLQPREGYCKYDNPASRLGPNPRLGIVHPTGPPVGELYVCEGLIDAYTAAGQSHHAIAVLGATYANQTVADRITKLANGRPIVVAFDNDNAGRTGSSQLINLMRQAGATNVVQLHLPPQCDLNTAHAFPTSHPEQCPVPELH